MRAHLLNSESPLKEGSTLTALCGAEVPTARFVFMLDLGFDQEYSLDRMKTCKDCFRLHVSDAPTFCHLLYGFVPGQQLITGENGPSL